MSPPKGRRFDERSWFSMPTHLRSMEQVSRYDRVRARRSAFAEYGIGINESLDLWDDRAIVSDHDNHLDMVIGQAECLAHVRGDDWIDRQISQHLDALLTKSNPGLGDPLGLEPSDDYRRYDPVQIAVELAGGTFKRQRKHDDNN